MFLKLAYLPSKLRFSGKCLFWEHQVSAGRLSADGSSTETLYCLNRALLSHHITGLFLDSQCVSLRGKVNCNYSVKYGRSSGYLQDTL